MASMEVEAPGDRLSVLYPYVNEKETPLPRQWSSKDKFTYIGLSQNYLRVHYNGMEGVNRERERERVCVCMCVYVREA